MSRTRTRTKAAAATQPVTVHLLPYAHLDVAWIHSRAWHIDRYVRSFDELLDRLDREPAFTSYLDTWREGMRAYSTLRPANFQRLLRFIRKGRVALCGGHYGNVRSSMVGDETFIRNLQHGLRAWRRHLPGVRPTVYANLDVTLGHSQLPQLLGLAGYRGYLVDRPLAALDQQGVPRAFHWRGLSGDRLTVCRVHYGGLYLECQRHGAQWTDDWPTMAAELRQTYLEAPLRDGLTHIAMSLGSDDARPDKWIYAYDRPCDYSALVTAWNEREHDTRLVYSTPDRLFQALSGERLRTVDGVLDPADVCYNAAPHGRRGLWWLREQADRQLVQAERLATFAALLHGQPYPTAALHQAWENLLDTTPHAVQWLFREDWQLAEQRLREAIAAAQQVQEDSAAVLTQATLPMDATALAVLNTSPRERREVLPIWLINTDLTRDIDGLLDARGREVPMQVIEYPVSNSECLLLAEVSVPACGQATLTPRWKPVPADTPGLIGDNNLGDSYNAYMRKQHGTPDPRFNPDRCQLTSAGLTLRFVGKRLVEIRDLAAGGATRRAARGTGFLEPVHFAVESTDWFIGQGIAENPDAPTFHDLRIDEQGPLRWRVTRTGSVGGYWFRQHLDLIKDLRGVRSTVQFLAPGENRSGFLGLAVPLPAAATLRADIPFGVEPRDLADFPYGRDERLIPGWMWARTWVAAHDPAGQMALLARDGDKFFRDHGRPRQLIHILARRTLVFEKGWENQIDTSDLGGRQVFEHELLLNAPDAGDLPLIQRAEAVRQPLHVGYTAAAPASVPPAGLKLTPATVQLNALYLLPGGACCLRLTQMAGRSARARLRLPFTPAKAEAVDLDGQPLPLALQLKGAELHVPLKPWQVCTIKLSR